MLGRAMLAFSLLAFAAADGRGASADDDGAVVVIRGSNVSVARPLTPERVRDGSAEVEIVRVEVPPEPAAPARRSEPEREVVVVVLPAAEPAPALGVPVWGAAWPWPVHPGFRPPDAHRRGHFLPGLHVTGAGHAPLRSGLRSR
jgi:hypothetical protein